MSHSCWRTARASGKNSLAANTSKFIEAAEKRPEIADISNFMSPSNLQYNLSVNTERATLQNMDVDEIYATIQAYMGSTFLNNFNIYGQEWQVYMRGGRTVQGQHRQAFHVLCAQQ